MLILGRAIQGIGAGGIFPVANAFIGDIFPPERRGGALGILSSIWGVSFVLGPILGGLLLNHGWQWLFIINIPVAVIVIIASLYILPKTDRNRMINFDWLGIITLSVLVSSLAYGINQINTNNFLVSITSLQVWPFLILAAVLLPVLWKVEEAAQDPLIQVDLFKSKEVKLITSIMVGTGLVQASTIFVPVFVIVALSFSITNASLMLLPIVLTMAIGGPIIGRLLDRYGSRNIMFTGTFIMIIGLFILSIFSKSFYLFVIGEILIGIGMSTAIGSPPRYIMLIESPPKERAAGQGLINIITSGGQLIGGALIGAVIGSYAGNLIGYQLAYLLIGFVAIFMTILTIGLKSKKEQGETMDIGT
jgi:MFS family permease